jgi:hypothetical protein
LRKIKKSLITETRSAKKYGKTGFSIATIAREREEKKERRKWKKGKRRKQRDRDYVYIYEEEMVKKTIKLKEKFSSLRSCLYFLLSLFTFSINFSFHFISSSRLDDLYAFVLIFFLIFVVVVW